MVFESLAGIFGMLALIVSISNTVWTWIRQGQSATSTRMAKAEEAQDKLEERIARLEGDYKHLPTKDDVNQISLKLGEMAGQQRAQDSELASVNRAVQRIETHLLREKA